MKLVPQKQAALWLATSALLLTSLIPGGPIENRDFSHIHPGILGLFNVFLTSLDLGSIPLAIFAWRGRRWALHGAFAAAVAYFGVYAVDLAQLFPRSPTPMSAALAGIEVLGMTVAIPLMFASRRAISAMDTAISKPPAKILHPSWLFAFLIMGTAIVWFATDAAMSGGTAALPRAGQVSP